LRFFWEVGHVWEDYRTSLENLIGIWWKRSDISGAQNQTVRFAKLDTPVLTGQEIMKELRENWGVEENKKVIDIIHIGSYHLENRNSWYFFDAWNSMSFPFIHLWTWFNDLDQEKDIQGIWYKSKDIMDLRDIYSLMASQQAIKVNNSHGWIDMVTKTEKLQIFWKPHMLTILDRFLKAITLEHLEIFNFQVVSFSIFGLYLISKEGYLDVTYVNFHWIRYKANI
jgi:hypothetical protein